MTIQVSRSEVFQAMSQVRHPEIPSRNLIELGMIPDVIIDTTGVQVTMALPTSDVPIKEHLIKLIQQAITRIAPDAHVEVHISGMTEAQKATFQAAVREELKVPMKPGVRIRCVLAVMSGKGGVGKSSVSGLLASTLRKRDFQVGLLDADITGPSIPKLFGIYQLPEGGLEGILPVDSQQGIKLMSINLLLPDENQPVVWRGPLISRTIQQFWSDIYWGNLDVLIVDLPPGTSDASLTVMQSLPLDGIILVTSPQNLAGMVVRKAANMAIGLGIKLIGLIENMSYIKCPKCGEKINLFGESDAEDIALSTGTRLLGKIPLDPRFSTLCDDGAIELYQSRAFESITDLILDITQMKEPEISLK